MKYINKQALNTTLVQSNNNFLPKADSQIRALTVHNPTDSHVDLTITIGSKAYIKKTIAAGSSEVISQIFNQHLNKDVPMAFTGTGLNVLMSVVEITS